MLIKGCENTKNPPAKKHPKRAKYEDIDWTDSYIQDLDYDYIEDGNEDQKKAEKQSKA